MYFFGNVVPAVVGVFPIDDLLAKAKYLVEIEDRIPPGFFIGHREMFERAIKFYLQTKEWKDRGVKFAQLTYEPNTKRSPHEPYREYYIWMERLNSLKSMTPIF